MGSEFPSISITVSRDKDSGSQAQLSELSIGFGLLHAWIYASMFGMPAIFKPSSIMLLEGSTGEGLSLAFVTSIICFSGMLLFAGITDQRFIKHYTSRKLMVLAAIATSIGTLFLFAASLPGFPGAVANIFAGVTTGVGSALLMLFWGVAYARNSCPSIVLNAAVAVVIAVAIYSALLHIIPFPFSGILAACLPVFQLPFLWKLTPISYILRHAIPIFNPLPIKKRFFAIRFVLPIFLFGYAIGVYRSVSAQFILPSADLTVQLLVLFAGGAATIVLLFSAFIFDSRGHWDSLFRVLLPIIAAMLLFFPSSNNDITSTPSLMLLLGFMCFEGMMWIFFGQICQEFRLSPILVFGIGRGCLALGSLFGSALVIDPQVLNAFSFINSEGTFAILVMLIAYAWLPPVRYIKRIARKSLINTDAEGIIEINEEAQRITFKNEELEASAKGENLEKRSTEDSKKESEEASTQDTEAEKLKKSGRFRLQCEIIANRYLLSRREEEVLFLLAKGFNAAIIQDKLYISKSTAKTHIAHIYRKLDIHNQHELIVMVEEAQNELKNEGN